MDYTTLTDQFVQEYTGADDFHTASKATIGYLSFNTQREATANADLRRAIAQAFDKQVYADSVIQDGSKVLNNQVPKDFDVNEAGEDYQTAAETHMGLPRCPTPGRSPLTGGSPGRRRRRRP